MSTMPAAVGDRAPWDRAVARIVGIDGRVAGLGVLVSGTEVVTCAHVITDALGGELAAQPPTGELDLVFPQVPGSRAVRARVSRAGWAKMEADFSGDVAVLELVGPAPAGAHPTRLARSGDLRGHEYELIGYRRIDVHPVEIRAHGPIVGFSADDRLQLGPATASGSRFKLDKGCSGTPVFDTALGHVVGLFQITDSSPGSDLSFALSASRVFGAWPGLLARYQRGCPYRALVPFGPGDPYFFGRAQLCEDIVTMVRRGEGWCVIQGPSGTGKTSLLQARVMPALRRTSEALAVLLRPTDRTTLPRALAAALRTRGPLSAVPPAEQGAAEQRHAEALEHNAYDELRAVLDGEGKRWFVVVVDQAEELLQADDPQRRDQFIATLLAWSRLRGPDGGPLLRVVLVVANPSSGQLLRLAGVAEAVAKIEYVGALGEDEIRAAIEAPLAVDGFAELAPGLAQRITRDLSANAYSLPVLQVLMTRLWDRDAAGGQLTFGTYESIRADRVFSGYLDEVWPKIGSARRGDAERLFLHLVVPLETASSIDPVRYTTRVAVRHELDEPQWALEQPLRTHRVIATSSAEGRDTIEFTHESVAQAWPAVQDLVEQHLPLLRWRQEARPRIDRWQQATGSAVAPGASSSRAPRRRYGRSGRLLSRSELADADTRLAHHEALLSTRETAFLRASRQRQRQLWWTWSAAVLAVVVAISLLGFIAAARGRATEEQQRIAAARDLVAQADALRDTDPRTALMLGVAALYIHPGGETRAALVNTLTTTHYGATLEGHRAPVESVAFSPDGRTLATASRDGSVILWDLTDPARPARLGNPLTGHRGWVLTVAFSPDGRTLATGSTDNTVILWDLTDRYHPVPIGKPLTGYKSWVTAVAFSPDGRTLATASDDPMVVLWDVTDRTQPARLGPPLRHGATLSVAFAPDGQTLATGSLNGAVILWDLTNRARAVPRGRPLTGHRGAVSSVAFSVDARTLAAGGGDGTTLLWNVTDPAHPVPFSQPLVGGNSSVNSVTFAPDGHTLATGSRDHAVILWDLADPAHPRRTGHFTGHYDSVESVAFSPDGRILASGSADNTVILWDMSARASPARLRPPFTGNLGTVSSAAFSGDASAMATVRDDGSVDLWDLKHPAWSGSLGRPFAGYNSSQEGSAVAFASSGRTLAAGAGRAIVVWNLTDRSRPVRIGQPLTLTDNVGTLAFSPDGRTLAAGVGGKTLLWRLTDGAGAVPSGELPSPNDRLWALAFSPDGHTLAVGGDNARVILWDLAHRPGPVQVGRPLSGHSDTVTSLAFSPDGRTLAAGSADSTIILWDLANRTRPVPLGPPLTGHSGTVFAAAFSPDSRTLATGSEDATVILWDLGDHARARELGTPLTGYHNWVYAVAFMPGGQTIATGTRTNAVVLWDLAGLSALRNHAVDRACALAGRGLNRDEWAHYVPGLPYHDTCTR